MESLTEREHLILEAVIRTFVETAEPAGSRTVARRFQLDISAATVRNTMSDLEEKGYLYHPHTSAGRVPTDRAYRFYVDSLLGQPRGLPAEHVALRQQLQSATDRSAVEQLIRHAAQVLGLLTQELGIAATPNLHDAVLERLELVPISAEKLLLVLALRSGGARTVFVDVPTAIPAATLGVLAPLLNERLAGLTLSQIRGSLPQRLRDSAPTGDPGAAALLNIFIQSADDWFEPALPSETLHLGRASVLADQPEFQQGDRLRGLMELTERRDLLCRVLQERTGGAGLRVTIGAEHADPALADFTVVTSEYRAGGLKGVLGVIGPTRMPYERVIALVESTSSLVSEFLAS